MREGHGIAPFVLAMWKVVALKKIRWMRVAAVLVMLSGILYGTSLAYNEYAAHEKEIENLQSVAAHVSHQPSEETSTPYTKVAPEGYSKLTQQEKEEYHKSHLMLDDDTIRTNKEKIKHGDFTGIKAIVYANSSQVAQWGNSTKEAARIKLSDSDQAKLDLLAAQYAGQEAGFEIEFYDNDGHFTINRLVLGGLKDKKPNSEPIMQGN